MDLRAEGQMPNKTVHWTRDKLNRWQVSFLAICAALAISTGVVGYVSVSLSQEVHNTACGLRESTLAGLHAQEEFLRDPSKFPEFNDPAIIKLTQSQVSDSRARLHDYSSLAC